MSASLAAPAPNRRALAAWGLAMCAYVVGVAGRTSLGVAGVQAIERFDLSASMLAAFSSLQLGVYALSQVPAGLVLDRVGPRRMLAGGAALLATGQVFMATASSLPLAFAARVLVGMGDATAFISVLRMLPSWFPVRRIPLLTQLTSILGQLGQVVSAWPFAGVLHRFGWTPAFGMLAALGFCAALLVLAFDADTPSDVSRGLRRRPRVGRSGRREPLRRSLARVLTEPATWLAFSTHWVGASPIIVFTLLWGVPFMTLGLGLSAAAASTVLVVCTVAQVLAGPAIGQLTAERPGWRAGMVAGAAAALVAAWVAAILPTAPGGLAVVLVLAVAVAVSGCASSIGFDFLRPAVPSARLGTAVGATNMGGFTGGLLTVQAIGAILDRHAGGAPLGYADFRVAMAAQVVTSLLGLIGVALGLRAVRRRARAGLSADPGSAASPRSSG